MGVTKRFISAEQSWSNPEWIRARQGISMQWLHMLSSSQCIIHLNTACLNQFREELSFLIHFFHLCKSSKGHSRAACSFWSSGMNSTAWAVKVSHKWPLACSNCFSQTSKATQTGLFNTKNSGSSLAYPHAQQHASRRLFQCCSVRNNASTKRLAGWRRYQYLVAGPCWTFLGMKCTIGEKESKRFKKMPMMQKDVQQINQRQESSTCQETSSILLHKM